MTNPTRPKSKKSSKSDRPTINLRSERIKRRLKQDDIRAGANIPLKYIKVLESGQYPNNPGEKFKERIRKYRKSYLRYMGLPSNSRLKFKKQSSLAVAVQEVTNIFSKTDALPHPSFLKTFIVAFISIIILVSLLRGVASIWDDVSNRPESISSIEETDVESSIDETSKEVKLESLATSDIFKGIFSKKSETPKAVTATPNIKIRVVEPVNLSVTVDGKRLLSRRVDPIQNSADREFQWDYDTTASINVSDISAIEIRKNKRKIEPMGTVTTGRKLTFHAKKN